MYLLTLFLPFCGAVVAGFCSRVIGRQGAVVITTTLVGLALLFSCILFYEGGVQGCATTFSLCRWMVSNLFCFSWGFLFDTLTTLMLVVVTFISFLVHLYASEYMADDPHLPRFMTYLSLFTLFMLILVTADNFVQMFVGWEGVGLCSFLLINFWYSRLQANKAAIKAMIVNRVGDFGLALGIFSIYLCFQSVEYHTVFATVPVVAELKFGSFVAVGAPLSWIAGFLFIGVMGKSAQLGLHSWLPDAMEGPTPVSALIHAATMVTAGVFLLGRCSPLYEYASMILVVVGWIGGLTAFFAGVTAMTQNDLKKVIAYSTCSQLGYMVLSCGLSNYSVGIFHLANHAFFKALLFLGAGSVIHGSGDEQDMRKMGGSRRLLPLTYAVMVIGSFSLMGFPFLTGFYSKDLILETAYASYKSTSFLLYGLGAITASLTAFYSIRLVALTFLAPSNYVRLLAGRVHESPIRMRLPLLILVVPSIFLGYIAKDMIVGYGTDFWGNSVFWLPSSYHGLDGEWIGIVPKLLPLCGSFFGSVLSYLIYKNFQRAVLQFQLSTTGNRLYNFSNRKWYFDKIANEGINQHLVAFGYHQSYKAIDRGLLESFGPLGFSAFAQRMGDVGQQLQTGHLFHAAFFIVGGISGGLCLVHAFPLFEASLVCIVFVGSLLHQLLTWKRSA